MPELYGKLWGLKPAMCFVVAGLLTACGDDSNSKPAPVTEPKTNEKPAAFNFTKLEASVDNDGNFVFTWNASEYAETYQVCRYNSSLEDVCDPIGEPVTTTSVKLSNLEIIAVQGSEYFIRAINEVGYTDSAAQEMTLTDFVSSISYLKAESIYENAKFGNVVSLSNDGNTLAVSTVNYQDYTKGGVYVFSRQNDNRWSKPVFLAYQGYEEHVGYKEDFSGFGRAISLSGDGNTLAVGAPNDEVIDRVEDLGDGDIKLWGSWSGTVYVYSRDKNGQWSAPVAVKKSNKAYKDKFGYSVSLNSDGTRMAVGAIWEGYDSIEHAGAVYVFDRNEQAGWGAPTMLKATVNKNNDHFGFDVSLSKSGHTLAVGAPSHLMYGKTSGSVYVFHWNDSGKWQAPVRIQATKTDKKDAFGSWVSLSGDGNTLVASAVFWDKEIDINGKPVYVYHRDANKTWNTQTPVKLNGSIVDGSLGSSLGVSDDGSVLAIGAAGDNSASFTEPSNENQLLSSGATYVFSRDARGVYGAPRYLKAQKMNEGDHFGTTVGLSGDGKTLVVGASGEDSGSNDQNDNSVKDAGAVYTYL